MLRTLRIWLSVILKETLEMFTPISFDRFPRLETPRILRICRRATENGKKKIKQVIVRHLDGLKQGDTREECTTGIL